MSKQICGVAGCGRVDYPRRGMCQLHYRRFITHGDVNATNRRTNADGKGYRAHKTQKGLHVVLAERALGRPLPPGAEVHHVNGDPSDNRPENLVVCPTRSYHALLHRRARALDMAGNPDARPCMFCRQWDIAPKVRHTTGGRVYHPACNVANAAKYQQERSHG